MSTEAVAQRLVDMCRHGDFEAAQKALYARDAISIEADGSSEVKGLDAIKKKGEKFMQSVEKFHGCEVSDPLVAGDWFSVTMALDVTMKGQGRMKMNEVCVYGVHDDKITHEQFFHNMH